MKNRTRYLHLLTAIVVLVTATSTCSAITPNRSSLLSTIDNYRFVTEQLIRVNQLPPSILFALQNKEIEINLSPPNKSQYVHYVDILSGELKKYPPDILNSNLMKIYIGGSYRQNGGTVGGLYSNQNIYVFYEQSNEKNKAIYLKQTFHHEFSSILIQAYGFPAFDWLKLNNPDFDYLINPRKIHEYLRSISVYEASEAQLKQGLVSSYGKSNAENDINTYVEMIFTEPKKMSKLINTYPIIHAKYDMIKAFYLSISSGFEPVFSAIK